MPGDQIALSRRTTANAIFTLVSQQPVATQTAVPSTLPVTSDAPAPAPAPAPVPATTATTPTAATASTVPAAAPVAPSAPASAPAPASSTANTDAHIADAATARWSWKRQMGWVDFEPEQSADIERAVRFAAPTPPILALRPRNLAQLRCRPLAAADPSRFSSTLRIPQSEIARGAVSCQRAHRDARRGAAH